MNNDAFLSQLGFDAFFSAQFASLPDLHLFPARVASDGHDAFHLLGVPARLATLSGKLRQAAGRPVVGDWVAVTLAGEQAVIRHVLPRRSEIVRRAAGSGARRQTVASNVDHLFIVTSANRDVNLRRIERYLTLTFASGARPVLVLNKCDLASDVHAVVAQLQTVAQDVPIHAVSAMAAMGVQDLAAYVQQGHTVAMLGSSGVGKSSLVNGLLGEPVLQTASVRGADDKGRHTTTHRQLIVLPSGGVLIDNPGLREVGLVEGAGAVDEAFADVASAAAGCRFRDCRHDGEPGCAVRRAVEEGIVNETRVTSHRRLRDEIATAEARRDRQSTSKRNGKSAEKAMRTFAKLTTKRRD